MVWLKDYMSKQEDVGYPLKGDITSSSYYSSSIHNLDINVYPNPAIRDVTIRNNSNTTERIKIYNLVGQVIEDFEINANSKVQLSLSAGMYLVNINMRQTVKLIVND
jgi:hypothetical protein